MVIRYFVAEEHVGDLGKDVEIGCGGVGDEYSVTRPGT